MMTAKKALKNLLASARANRKLTALAVLAVGGLSRGLLAAAVGGAFTAIGPVLLWITFVLRPDRHPHKAL